jgi:hypothetical protein
VGTSACPKIFIGTPDSFTPWTVVSLEGLAGSGALLSLRSAGSFGILPDLVPGNIPEGIRVSLVKSVDSIVAARAAIDPNSTIDRCREALTIIFGDLCEDRTKDLGKSPHLLRYELRRPSDGWILRMVSHNIHHESNRA